MLLELGAANVTTLEYNNIESRVGNLNVIMPEELRRLWKSSSREKLDFDAVVSFSSIEHSGLGRYGDALNPWGDLIAAAQAWLVAHMYQGQVMFVSKQEIPFIQST